MKRSGPIARKAPLRRRKPLTWRRRKGIRAKAPRRLKTAQNDKAYRDWVRMRDCISCGRRPTEESPNQPAHMTLSANQKGAGMKTPDRQVVPLCNECHEDWDRHQRRFKGWTKGRRYMVADFWVGATQMAAEPDNRDHARALERLGLGRAVSNRDGTWAWIPGPAREAA